MYNSEFVLSQYNPYTQDNLMYTNVVCKINELIEKGLVKESEYGKDYFVKV